MALVMLAVLGVFVLGGAVLAGLATGASGIPGTVLALAALAVLNVVLFAVAYRVLTAAALTWRQVLPGASVAGIGWTVLLSIGGWIVADRVSSSSDVYGTFALVIGLLAWIYLGAQLTLYGAEVNAVQQHGLWPRSMQGELTKADRQRCLRRSAMQEERKEEENVDVTFGDDDGSEPTVGSRAAGTTPPTERRSMAALTRSVIEGVTQLFRHEVELAKIEASRGHRGPRTGDRVARGGRRVGAVRARVPGRIGHGGPGHRAPGVGVPVDRGRCVHPGRGDHVPGRTRGDAVGGRGRADTGDGEGGRPVGEAADRKVKEIEQTRRQIEADLTELEARIPSPLRSMKTLMGTAVGSTTLAGLIGMQMKKRRTKRRADDRTTEIVVRVVRDDVEVERTS